LNGTGYACKFNSSASGAAVDPSSATSSSADASSVPSSE